MLGEYGAKRVVLSCSKESGEKNSAEEFCLYQVRKQSVGGDFGR